MHCVNMNWTNFPKCIAVHVGACSFLLPPWRGFLCSLCHQGLEQGLAKMLFLGVWKPLVLSLQISLRHQTTVQLL